MLEHSILGTVYRWWIHSVLFSLLQRFFRPFLTAARNSTLLRVVFHEGWLENAFRHSLCAGLIRSVTALLLKFCGLFRGLADGAEHSAVLNAVRGSVVGFLVSFEGLFGAFLFVMFVTPHQYWNNLYAVLAAFAFLLLYLLLAASGRRSPVSPEVLGLGGLGFLLALVLSMGFSSAPKDSLRILLFFLASLAFCYTIAADFREPEKLRKLLAFLYAALILVSLYGIAQRVFHLVRANASFTDMKLNVGMPGRVYSTLDNPINLSEFVLLFMPLGAAFAAGAKKPFARFLLCCGLVCPALALVLTYSRGGWLAVCIAAAVFTWCCNKRLVPALAVLGLMALPLLPASILARLSTIGNTKDTSTQHRLDIWHGVLRILSDKDRFFTGIGLGPECFRIVYPFYSQGIAKVGAYHSQLHYLELVLEMGILGLVSFLYMMCKYLGRATDAIRSGRSENRFILIACISSLAALAFVGLVEYVWFYQRIMFAFFIFLGILLAAAGEPEQPKLSA